MDIKSILSIEPLMVAAIQQLLKSLTVVTFHHH
jgi:hypothetical protein